MAIKYQCDRCKKLQDEPLHPVQPRDEEFNDNFRDYRLRDLRNRYELCENCLVLVAMVLDNANTKVVYTKTEDGL